jgi:hypothetical protein
MKSRVVRCGDRVVCLSSEVKRRRVASESGTATFASHVSDSGPFDCVVLEWNVFCGLREDSARAADVLGVPSGTVWTVCLERERRCELSSDVLWWDAILTALALRRKYLMDTLALISTLGGGWASVGQRSIAKQFAHRQLAVARMLGDETLELLSNVYIGYALLFEGHYESAKAIIDQQTLLAKRRGEPRQLRIVDAARLQLERWQQQQQQQQIPN